MVRPRSQELARSGRTPLDPDNVATQREAHEPPGVSGQTGPVPEDNRPGHHPDDEQDRPDLDHFAERFGIAGPDTEPDTETDTETDTEIEAGAAESEAGPAESSGPDDGSDDGGSEAPGLDRRLERFLAERIPVCGEHVGRAAGWSSRVAVGSTVAVVRVVERTTAVGIGVVRVVSRKVTRSPGR